MKKEFVMPEKNVLNKNAEVKKETKTDLDYFDACAQAFAVMEHNRKSRIDRLKNY